SGVPSYFIDAGEGCHDPFLLEKVNALGLEYISRLNAGLLYVPKGALSIDLAAQILADWRPEPLSYFTPQTVMSVLMRHANAQPLPDIRYVISICRQFYWEQD